MFRPAVTALVGVLVVLFAVVAPAAAQDDIADLVEEATGLVEHEIRLMHALHALEVVSPPPVWFTAILQGEPEPFGNPSTLVDQLTSVEEAAQNIRDILAGRNHQVSGSVDAVLLIQPPGVHQALRNGVPTTPVSLGVYRRALDDLEQRLGQGFDPVPSPPARSSPLPVLAVAAGSIVFVALPILLSRRRRRHHDEPISPTPAAGIDELELGHRLMAAPDPHARLDDEAQAARSDGLTGLANRRRFDNDLQRSVPDWLATGMPVACAMVDIDHFKSINDRFGHPVGDVVLRRVAGLLKAAVRGDDIAYRYGGEEFSVLLPGATQEVARGVAERIRLAVAATVFSELDGSITVSVGVTTAAGLESTDLVRRADEALHDAKRSGRNRVVAR